MPVGADEENGSRRKVFRPFDDRLRSRVHQAWQVALRGSPPHGSAGSTSYGCNDALVTSVADAVGTTSYTYNADSQVSGISYGSGKDTRSFGYDARHRLTSSALKTSAGTTIASVGYGYNADDEITSEATTGLAGPASSSYTYDQAGRLTSWNNGTTTTSYGYDPNGNLTQSGSKTFTYDARDEKTSDGTNSYTFAARGTPSTETGPSSPLAVTFDAYGDQAAVGTRSYGYDALGRLTSDTGATGTQYAFSYAGSTGAIASDGTSTYTWDPSGSVLAAIGVAGGTTAQGVLALTNSHGDVVGQYTATGTTVAGSSAYNPWGAVTATTGSVTGLLGYQSAWSDQASGKSLMGARWYDPSAGDFTSADTVQVNPEPDPAAGDPFAYAADNPLDLTDPSGHMPLVPRDDPNYQRDEKALLAQQAAQQRKAAAAREAAAKAAAAREAAAKRAAPKKNAAKTATAKKAAPKKNAAKAAAAREAAAKKAAPKKAAAKIPRGFANKEAFEDFSGALRSGLSQAGYGDTEPIFQGSSVTGIRHRDGTPVGNNPGDYDIALAGSDIFNAGKKLRIKLRGGGVRTGPLTPTQLRQLGLADLTKELSAAAGRPVKFMIYQSSEAAMGRSPSIPAASESEINTARPAGPTESGPGAEGADAGAGDVLGPIAWILLFIDAQRHGGMFSPGGCRVLMPSASLCPSVPPGTI